jgi:integrase
MATVKLTERIVSSLEPPADAAQGYTWDEEVIGLGIKVGARTRTFIVRGRIAGSSERVQITIGQHGATRPQGDTWTVTLARQRARELLGQMAAGINPAKPAPEVTPTTGPTLRDGVEAHLARMKAKNRSERTIGTFTHETGKYLGPWLDTPINDLDCEKIQAHVKANVSARRGAVNKRGAMVANRVLAHVSASWRSLNRKLKGKLGTWNPAAATDKDKYIPSRTVVEDLPGWAARVGQMRSAIRRDGLMLALYTGLRHEDVRSIRIEHVDFDARMLKLPDPKGGEGKAFAIPLSKTPLAILERRRDDNARDVGADPKGWMFPAVDAAGKMGAICNLRELHGDGRWPAEDVHTLRRTYISIAQEEGISELDQMVLSNHSFAAQSVHRLYIRQHFDHLAACADKIDAGITRRLNAPTDRKGRGKLRAVA